MAKKICEVCKGNGFVRVPYEIAREEQWADCSFCNNQGEIETHEEDKMANLINPKGSHDLEQRIADLTKQKEFLQSACKRAGAEIKELKDTVQKLEKIAALTREDVLSRLKDAENYFKTDDYTEDR